MAIPERPLATPIRSARMERQLTQGELAARIGVDAEYGFVLGERH